MPDPQSSTAALLDDARRRLAAGDAAGAAGSLDRALAADPGSAAALFLRAQLHLMAGTPAAAEALLRRGRDADPANAPMAFLHGLSLHLSASPAAAARAFEETCRLAPDHGEALLFLGRSLRDAGDLPGCRRARDDLAARFGGVPRLLNELASDLIDEGDEPAAAELLERALAASPGAPDLLHNLGVACARLGLIGQAEQALRAALAAGPEAAATRATLAEVLRTKDRAEDAADLARSLLASGAETGRAHGVLATIAMAQERHDDGIAHFRAALAAAGADGVVEALWNLGCACEEAGRPAEAAECWARLLDERAAARPSAERIRRDAGRKLRLARGEPAPGETVLRLASLADQPAAGEAPLGDVVELSGAGLFADHWHILDGDRLLPDLVFHLPIGDDGLVTLFGREGAVLARTGFPEREVEEPCLFLGGAHNYYHWLADYLPRLSALEAEGPWRHLPLVTSSRPAPYEQRLLELLGVDPARLRPAEPGTIARFRQLWVPRLPGRRLRPGGVPEWMCSALAPDTASWLRRRCASFAVPEPDGPRRIMLLRGETAFRRCENEAQLVEVARARGFVPVRPETLPVERQAALFAGAQIVLSVHGAGCTNMLFAPPGAVLVELHPAGHLPDFYTRMTGLLGQEHRALGGPPTRSVGSLTPYHWHFRIDPAELDAVLAEVAA
ncbi:glycosyltransferase 61 family protein [Arenibaculum sp.]|uniref:glycosyltransferase 61 family protein n=1 Tax=Arenibaculum sp. TaxID=2865862 RepID=UPI002E0FE04E|nr:glycosyltransferase 61 family protein [Arenibaculum sp.]